MQNMTAGFNQSNRLLVVGFAGMCCWKVCDGWCRHRSRIEGAIANNCVGNHIQILQTYNALVSHADKVFCEIADEWVKRKS